MSTNDFLDGNGTKHSLVTYDGVSVRSLLVLTCTVSAIIPALGQSRIAIESVTVIDATDHAPRRNITAVVRGKQVEVLAEEHIKEPNETRKQGLAKNRKSASNCRQAPWTC